MIFYSDIYKTLTVKDLLVYFVSIWDSPAQNCDQYEVTQLQFCNFGGYNYFLTRFSYLDCPSLETTSKWRLWLLCWPSLSWQAWAAQNVSLDLFGCNLWFVKAYTIQCVRINILAYASNLDWAKRNLKREHVIKKKQLKNSLLQHYS